MYSNKTPSAAGNTQQLSEVVSGHLEVLHSTVEEFGRIMQGSVVIVIQETVLPGVPRLAVHQLWDWSVEEGDGCPRVVVVWDPLDGFVNTVLAPLCSSGTCRARWREGWSECHWHWAEQLQPLHGPASSWNVGNLFEESLNLSQPVVETSLTSFTSRYS